VTIAEHTKSSAQGRSHGASAVKISLSVVSTALASETSTRGKVDWQPDKTSLPLTLSREFEELKQLNTEMAQLLAELQPRVGLQDQITIRDTLSQVRRNTVVFDTTDQLA